MGIEEVSLEEETGVQWWLINRYNEERGLDRKLGRNAGNYRMSMVCLDG